MSDIRSNPATSSARSRDGILAPLPTAAPKTSLPAGLHRIRADGTRDTLLHLPDPLAEPAPLVISLHGAGAEARQAIELLRRQADTRGFALLAPSAYFPTWDVIARGFGPDIEALNHSLAWVFERVAVDGSRLAIGGFSDGASYALTVGLSNGEQLRTVLAFSPGFMVPSELHGKPRVFISHGTHDGVLPVERCGRPVAAKLRSLRYDLEYREFDGAHTAPESIRDAAVDWWLGPDV